MENVVNVKAVSRNRTPVMHLHSNVLIKVVVDQVDPSTVYSGTKPIIYDSVSLIYCISAEVCHVTLE